MAAIDIAELARLDRAQLDVRLLEYGRKVDRLTAALEKIAAIVPDCGDTGDLIRRVDVARAVLGRNG